MLFTCRCKSKRFLRLNLTLWVPSLKIRRYALYYKLWVLTHINNLLIQPLLLILLSLAAPAQRGRDHYILQIPLLQTNNFMKKEKLNRHIPKPELSLICPPKMLFHLTPEQILTQHFKEAEYEEPPKHHSQNLKQLVGPKRPHPMTCMDWFKGSEHTHKQDPHREIDDGLLEMRTQSFVKRKQEKSKQQHRRFVCRNSPYVKNKQQYQRIMNNLKPVKGPTDSLMRQIKRHNDQNRKNAENVLLATKDSFKEKISKYSSRIGLKNSEKIFVMNSKDAHIREALVRNGWVESTDLTSTFFHLKWAYTDSPVDYTKLQQGQFYNHFKNNQQLTNKNLFRKNIYKNPAHLRPNYPSTFDLQLNGNQQKFQFEYIKYEYFKILATLQSFITQTQPAYYNKLMRINCLNIRHVSMGGMLNLAVDRNRHKDFVRALAKSNGDDGDGSTAKRQLRQSLYCFCFGLGEIQESQTNRNRKYSYLSINSELTDILKVVKQPLSKLQDDILEEEIEIKSKNKIRVLLSSVLQQDRFLLFLIAYLYRKFENRFSRSFGMENWWIIKPAGVSRGTGIKIQADYAKIINSKYGKVVQKYIERPLLLRCGRKFDIRQWVLVRSFLPLDAYVFKNCYCRFSAQKYNPDNFRSLSVHLTNYSKQKESYMRTGKTGDSIKCEQEFQKEIDQLTYRGKWLQIKSQIKQQIIKSLKCCEYEVEDKSECFEVYGFDVILDEDYRPWVLEVNMSPACDKRAEFLDAYLRQMAEGVVDLVEEREIRNWEKLAVDESFAQKMLKNKNRSIACEEDAVCKIQKFYRKHLKQKNGPSRQTEHNRCQSKQPQQVVPILQI